MFWQMLPSNPWSVTRVSCYCFAAQNGISHQNSTFAADVCHLITKSTMTTTINIARRLSEMASRFPDQRALVEPQSTDRAGRVTYSQMTFAQLDEETDRIAAGLIANGLKPGMRMVLFVPFSMDFISFTFALFKAGAVIVLIDPGMGRTNIFNCLEEVKPDGFVAIPKVHAMRWVFRKRFPTAKLNFSIGGWFPGVASTDQQLRQAEAQNFRAASTTATDEAAIIFTSGSTGPPKGVVYEHGMFDAQVELIRDFYNIEACEIDLPGFPLFGLFNAAMGVTTVIPDMDPTKPAQVDPEKIIQAIRDQGVTQAFGSPAFWNRVGRFCVENEVTFPSIRRALSAGGPVPIHVLQRMQKILIREGADIFTPYGATESLPVASICGRDVLTKTAEQTSQGHGTCVGHRFPGVDVKIIPITDEPIASLDDVSPLAIGEIGEIIVSSRSVTRNYFQREQATKLAKIPDGERFWHRIGDVGYLDDEDRLWFCGRKAHIVDTPKQRLYSVRCEAIFNNHPQVYRSALVGLGPERKTPGIVVEPEPGQFPTTKSAEEQFRSELLQRARANSQTEQITIIEFHKSLPVDTRHNVKINREALVEWATNRRAGKS